MSARAIHLDVAPSVRLRESLRNLTDGATESTHCQTVQRAKTERPPQEFGIGSEREALKLELDLEEKHPW